MEFEDHYVTCSLKHTWRQKQAHFPERSVYFEFHTMDSVQKHSDSGLVYISGIRTSRLMMYAKVPVLSPLWGEGLGERKLLLFTGRCPVYLQDSAQNIWILRLHTLADINFRAATLYACLIHCPRRRWLISDHTLRILSTLPFINCLRLDDCSEYTDRKCNFPSLWKVQPICVKSTALWTALRLYSWLEINEVLTLHPAERQVRNEPPNLINEEVVICCLVLMHTLDEYEAIMDRSLIRREQKPSYNVTSCSFHLT
jgi:hypothetical protein